MNWSRVPFQSYNNNLGYNPNSKCRTFQRKPNCLLNTNYILLYLTISYYNQTRLYSLTL